MLPKFEFEMLNSGFEFKIVGVVCVLALIDEFHCFQLDVFAGAVPELALRIFGHELTGFHEFSAIWKDVSW